MNVKESNDQQHNTLCEVASLFPRPAPFSVARRTENGVGLGTRLCGCKLSMGCQWVPVCEVLLLLVNSEYEL